MKTKDIYYTILGSSEHMSLEEISKNYKNRVRILHPDRFDPVQQPKDWENTNRMLQELNEAYEYIKQNHHLKTDFDSKSSTHESYSTADKNKSKQSENSKQKTDETKRNEWRDVYNSISHSVTAKAGMRVKVWDTKYIGTIREIDINNELVTVDFSNSTTGNIYKTGCYKYEELLTIDNKKLLFASIFTDEDYDIFFDNHTKVVFADYTNHNYKTTFADKTGMFFKGLCYGIILVSFYYIITTFFNYGRH